MVQKGLTLIEMIISISLLCIIFLLITVLYSDTISMYIKNSIMQEIHQEARHAMYIIERDVNTSDHIYVVKNEYFDTYENKYKEKTTLKMKSKEQNIEIYWEYKNGKKILYEKINDQPNPITRALYNIDFYYYDNILTVNLSTGRLDPMNKPKYIVFNISKLFYSKVLERCK